MNSPTFICLLCGLLLFLAQHASLIAQDQSRASDYARAKALIEDFEGDKSDSALSRIVGEFKSDRLGGAALELTRSIVPLVTTDQCNLILIPALKDVLETGSRYQRQQAWMLVESLGARAAELESVILEELERGNPVVGISAVNSLDAIGPLSTVAIELLKKKLSETSDAKCDDMTELCLPAMMVRLLGKSCRKDDGIYETIQGKLKDRNRFVKSEAIRYVVTCNGFDTQAVDETVVELRSGDRKRVWLALSLLNDLVFDSRVKAFPETIKRYVVGISESSTDPVNQQEATDLLDRINRLGK